MNEVFLDWETFQIRYLAEKTIFVKEFENKWVMMTYDGPIIIKCEKKKSKNSEENIMFIDRYLGDRKNIVKVLKIKNTIKLKDIEEEPKNVLEEPEYNETGITTTDDEHNHKYKINKFGDGYTTYTSKGEEHVHEIMDYDIEVINEHLHLINKPEENKNDLG